MRLADDAESVEIIDQRRLPFAVEIESIHTYPEMITAIRDMHVRGAPLIGASAAYGVYLACLEFSRDEDGDADVTRFDKKLERAMRELDAARPTAVNLRWAIERQRSATAGARTVADKVNAARATADTIAEDDVAMCVALGRHGAEVLAEICDANGGKTVNVLTHCNAGWLATVDHGTVTAVLYETAARGVPLHVWVDETRPRNQGSLTSWELTQNGVDNTVICDNAGGHVMQHGMVDAVIVGTDRTARNGDVANKIGTYLKALAARDNNVPFYVALPSPSFDPRIEDGLKEIPIEQRDPAEVLTIRGARDGRVETVSLFAPDTRAANYAFDVTPARLVTGYMTEKGVFTAEELAHTLADERFAGVGNRRDSRRDEK
ncbi:MAG: S-methyl-5-thioribose-1-phosphate isomerase [Spirochaetaceae bacterium]|nr:MAG: S-methyl-5-thioribose-1-phosphate isomerase [Spirochaetaceae bacterium]